MLLQLVTLLMLALTATSAEDAEGKLAKFNRNIINPDPDPNIPKEVVGEFRKGFFEGDIVEKTGKKVKRNAVKDKRKLWPDRTVPYEIDEYTDATIKNKIHDAIADFHQYTCLKFVPHANEKDFLWFNSYDDGCNTEMGRDGGQQTLNLAAFTCSAKGSVIHEMMHAIGFGHEQSRNDRDDYVTINKKNIRPGYEHNFAKLGDLEDTQGLPYDYYSVMHYPDSAFAPGGHWKPSITTKDESVQRIIGQRLGFSRGDVLEINKLYGCDDVRGIDDGNECVDHYMASTCEMNFQEHSKMSACGEESYFSVLKMCRKSCGAC